MPTGILVATDDGEVLLLDLTKFHYDESTKSYTDGTTTYEEGRWAEVSSFATLKATSFDELKYLTNLETIRNGAFSNCTSLSNINFNGTIAQWKAITKGTGWNIGVPSTTKVTCTDGQTTMD